MFLQCIPIYYKHRFYFISLDNHREFIHMLSPVKQSRNQNQWFNFNLQTSPTKVWRVVAFNIGSHSTLKKQQQQRNKKRKQGQSCHIQPAAECTDCTKVWHLFWLCSSQATSQVCHFTSTCHNNNSETNFPINKLIRENVIATVSLRSKQPKPVHFKTAQQMSSAKVCVLEDNTGTAMLHIWYPLLKQTPHPISRAAQSTTLKAVLIWLNPLQLFW